MKTIVLTFDDACRSQLEYAVPLLKKYGFGATFFISLPECWNEIPGAHLSKQEISGFYEQGFELGNHTMNHPDMRRLDDAGCREEISIMDRIIRESGAPSPVSFAYPGGPLQEMRQNFCRSSGSGMHGQLNMNYGEKRRIRSAFHVFLYATRRRNIFRKV